MTNDPTQRVQVTDVRIPFFSLVALLVKISLAAIPALFILAAIGVLVGKVAMMTLLPKALVTDPMAETQLNLPPIINGAPSEPMPAKAKPSSGEALNHRNGCSLLSCDCRRAI